MNEERETKLAYSIPETAKASGLSASYLYKLSAEGKLPVSKIGSRCVIPVESFRDWLCGHLRNGGGKKK